MSLWKQFLDDYKARKKMLERQIALLEAGNLHTGERSGPGPWKDTPQETLQDCKQDLAVIERLIEEAESQLARGS